MHTGPLFIASDHAGYQLKRRLVRFIEKELALAVTDIGPAEYQAEDDYPDYALPLARQVAETDGRGILICKNGIGVCIAANKVKNVRAGLGYNLDVAETMRQEDDANVLCLPAKLLSADHAMAIVKRWLGTEFSGAERHVRRLEKIQQYAS